eukprot:29786-Pelagococcus_subviridis.AAC.5
MERERARESERGERAIAVVASRREGRQRRRTGRAVSVAGVSPNDPVLSRSGASRGRRCLRSPSSP